MKKKRIPRDTYIPQSHLDYRTGYVLDYKEWSFTRAIIWLRTLFIYMNIKSFTDIKDKLWDEEKLLYQMNGNTSPLGKDMCIKFPYQLFGINGYYLDKVLIEGFRDVDIFQKEEIVQFSKVLTDEEVKELSEKRYIWITNEIKKIEQKN